MGLLVAGPAQTAIDQTEMIVCLQSERTVQPPFAHTYKGIETYRATAPTRCQGGQEQARPGQISRAVTETIPPAVQEEAVMAQKPAPSPQP